MVFVLVPTCWAGIRRVAVSHLPPLRTVDTRRSSHVVVLVAGTLGRFCEEIFEPLALDALLHKPLLIVLLLFERFLDGVAAIDEVIQLALYCLFVRQLVAHVELDEAVAEDGHS